MFAETLLLGAVVWFVTTVIVESELTRPIREAIVARFPGKVGYLVNCHMCAGTWVGLGVGFLHPLALGSGWVVACLLSGLAYKAVGHLILGVNNLLERCAR